LLENGEFAARDTRQKPSYSKIQATRNLT